MAGQPGFVYNNDRATGKCIGAETLLRAVIDNSEGVNGGMKRQAWLDGQPPAFLQELADACLVLAHMCDRAMTQKRLAGGGR